MKEPVLEPIFRSLRVNTIRPYIPENATLCDIGCGFKGSFLRTISPDIRQGYGFDKKVSACLEKNYHLITWNLDNSLPLEDNSVNCVTLLAVLEHLSDPEFVFSEISRICIPGGRLILTTPSPSSKPILEFLSFSLGIVSKEEIADHKHYWTLKEIEQLVENNKFQVLEIKHFSCGLNSLCIGERIQS